jgi:hypothetical protein
MLKCPELWYAAVVNNCCVRGSLSIFDKMHSCGPMRAQMMGSAPEFRRMKFSLPSCEHRKQSMVVTESLDQIIQLRRTEDKTNAED